MPQQGRRSGNQTRGRPSRRAVAREVKDILLKRLAATVSTSFVAALGLDLPPVVAMLPNDPEVLRVQTEAPDLLLHLADDTITDFEFQMTSKASDLERFLEYNIGIHQQHHRWVRTIVVYGQSVRSAPSELVCGSITFRVTNVYLADVDAEQLVVRLQAHAAAGEPWTVVEQVQAMLLPLLGRARPLPVLLQEVAAASAVLPDDQREDVLGSMVGLAYNYLDEGVAEQLLEVLRAMNKVDKWLANYVYQRWDEMDAQRLAEVREEGIEKGREEGRAMLRHAVLQRFGQIPPTLAARISRADGPVLETLLDQVLGAQSLDEVAAG